MEGVWQGVAEGAEGERIVFKVKMKLIQSPKENYKNVRANTEVFVNQTQ